MRAITHRGPSAVDVPLAGIGDWSPGETREVSDEVADLLLTNAIFAAEPVPPASPVSGPPPAVGVHTVAVEVPDGDVVRVEPAGQEGAA